MTSLRRQPCSLTRLWYLAMPNPAMAKAVNTPIA